MTKFEVIEEFVYNPESVDEGYRLLGVFLANAYIKKRSNEAAENRKGLK